jgi:hypothetical protein
MPKNKMPKNKMPKNKMPKIKNGFALFLIFMIS